MGKRCKHRDTRRMWWVGTRLARWTTARGRGLSWDDFAVRVCNRCGAWLPLGPSRDDDPRVAVEIRAAELALTGQPSANTRDGARLREGCGWEACACGFGIDWCSGNADCEAGHLARLITEHEETMTDYKKLRELAERATQGSWRNGTDPCHYDAPEVTDDKTFAYYVPDANNAAFIAAASPDVVIVLLDEVEKWRRAGFDGIDTMAEHLGRAQSNLAAVTAARDELADIAQQSTHAIGFRDERELRLARIDTLRAVGGKS